MGMRIGEVCGLRWCDVDFETGLISIRHSVAYAKGMGSFIKDTKTHDARGIPIDPVGLLPFLKETHEIDCGKLRLRGLTGAVEIGDCYILSEPARPSRRQAISAGRSRRSRRPTASWAPTTS